MKDKKLMIVARAVLGLALLAGGIYLVVLADKTGSSAIAQNQNNVEEYYAEWNATHVLAVDTSAMRVKFSHTNPRKWLAIGPASWDVKYYQGSDKNGALMAAETWTVKEPNCYANIGSNNSPCKPGGSNAGSYLYGLASEQVVEEVSKLNFTVLPVTEPNLYIDSINPRFQGPAAVAETNQGDNIEGWQSPAAYGWWAGTIGVQGDREYTTAAGVLIPLHWTINGELYN